MAIMDICDGVKKKWNDQERKLINVQTTNKITDEYLWNNWWNINDGYWVEDVHWIVNGL